MYVDIGKRQMMYQNLVCLIGLVDKSKRLASLIYETPSIFLSVQILSSGKCCQKEHVHSWCNQYCKLQIQTSKKKRRLRDLFYWPLAGVMHIVTKTGLGLELLQTNSHVNSRFLTYKALQFLFLLYVQLIIVET